jgi:NADPH:quinone reductase
VDTPAELRRRSAEVLRDLKAGILRLSVEKVFPLSEAAAAHALLESRRVRGKVLLVP